MVVDENELRGIPNRDDLRYEHCLFGVQGCGGNQLVNYYTNGFAAPKREMEGEHQFERVFLVV